MAIRWNMVGQAAYTMTTDNWWSAYTAFGAVCSDDLLMFLRCDHYNKAVNAGIVFC